MIILQNLLGAKRAHALVLAIGCLLICFSCYGLYDRYHISSDLRRSLTAITNNHNNLDDIQSYLRQARLQVRTTKDQEILETCQNAFDELIMASETEARVEVEMSDLSTELEKAKQNLKDSDNIEEIKQSFRLRGQRLRKEEVDGVQQMAKAQQHFESVRNDLGLASTKDSWSTKPLPQIDSSNTKR